MTAPLLKALIFDVDGTLAETELTHLAAFNAAFADLGLPWRWAEDEYRELLRVSGGKERIAHYWRGVDPVAAAAPEAAAQIDQLHACKTDHYGRLVRQGVPLRPGVEALIDTAEELGLRLAIATTTTPANLDALLEPKFGAAWRERFAVIEDASTAPIKKPDPQAYRQALDRLGLDASQCIAFEDSENGLKAALAADLTTIVTPSFASHGDDLPGAALILPDLGDAPRRLREGHWNFPDQLVRQKCA